MRFVLDSLILFRRISAFEGLILPFVLAWHPVGCPRWWCVSVAIRWLLHQLDPLTDLLHHLQSRLPVPCVLFPGRWILHFEVIRITEWALFPLVTRLCFNSQKTHFAYILFGLDLFVVGHHPRSKPLLHVIVRAVSTAECDELSGSCCCWEPSSLAPRGGWSWLLIFYPPWENFAAHRLLLRSHVRQMTFLLCTP
jgi:hypothetical protein